MKYFVNTIVLFTIALFLLPWDESQAIPAFARKYKFSCNTCHAAVPKLKDYGDEFAGNGFLIPDGEEPKRAYVNTGDESLLLMRELPLAIRLDAYVQIADRDRVKNDIQAPYGIKLMSGGPIFRHVSYYFYFYISERGEVAGVEDAIVHFNNIAGTEFDLALGQFQVSDPLFKRELRLTFEDYWIYKLKPALSRADLTYDRGLMATYGFDFGLDLTGMIVNGNGIKEADEDRLFDFDSNKSLAFRAIQGIGPINAGAFVYSARETLADSANADNDILIYGPDITVGNDNIELNAQYLYREDKNPNFYKGQKKKLNSEGGFVELVYLPAADQSKFIFTGLFNYLNSKGDDYDYRTATLSVSHMAARNLRILAEITYDLVNEKPRFTTGIMAAF